MVRVLRLPLLLLLAAWLSGCASWYFDDAGTSPEHNKGTLPNGTKLKHFTAPLPSRERGLLGYTERFRA